MARDNFKLIELNMALQKTESPKHKISLKITIDKDFGSIVVKAIDYKFPRIDTVHKAKFEMPSDEIIKRHIQRSQDNVETDKKAADTHKENS